MIWCSLLCILDHLVYFLLILTYHWRLVTISGWAWNWNQLFGANGGSLRFVYHLIRLSTEGFYDCSTVCSRQVVLSFTFSPTRLRCSPRCKACRRYSSTKLCRVTWVVRVIPLNYIPRIAASSSQSVRVLRRVSDLCICVISRSYFHVKVVFSLLRHRVSFTTYRSLTLVVGFKSCFQLLACWYWF
jgi:hypothetical protein